MAAPAPETADKRRCRRMRRLAPSAARAPNRPVKCVLTARRNRYEKRGTEWWAHKARTCCLRINRVFRLRKPFFILLTGPCLVIAPSRSARKKNQWVEGIIKTLQSQKPISSLDLHIPKRKVQRTISMKNMRYINRILKVSIFILNINPSRKELSQPGQ